MGSVERETGLRRWWNPVVIHVCVCDDITSQIVCVHHWRCRKAIEYDLDFRNYRMACPASKMKIVGIPPKEYFCVLVGPLFSGLS